MPLKINEISTNMRRYGAHTLKQIEVKRIMKIAIKARDYVNSKDDPKAWQELVKSIREVDHESA